MQWRQGARTQEYFNQKQYDISKPFKDCFDGSDEGWCDPEHDPNAAEPCDYANCSLPDCFCSVDGTLVPDGLDPKDVPQLIYITFDDAVNDDNWKLYQERIFPSKYKNPNGCPIHGTFYVSHEFTNYAMVNKLSNQGHEIAVNSITNTPHNIIALGNPPISLPVFPDF
mgnify:CR=1 FL=1